MMFLKYPGTSNLNLGIELLLIVIMLISIFWGLTLFGMGISYYGMIAIGQTTNERIKYGKRQETSSEKQQRKRLTFCQFCCRNFFITLCQFFPSRIYQHNSSNLEIINQTTLSIQQNLTKNET